jgi:integrase
MEGSSFSNRLTQTFWHVFKQEVHTYFAELTKEQTENLTKEKTEELSQKLIVLCTKMKLRFSGLLKEAFDMDDSKQVSALCLKKIVNGFKSDMEERKLCMDMLELTLKVLKAELGISAPFIPVFTVLNRDKPVLTPDKLIKANLASELYELCEKEQVSPSVGISPELVLGRLALWLMLKEGALDKKMLLAMLNEDRAGWLRYDDCIYFQHQEQRVLVGKATELFLNHYWFMQQGCSLKPDTYMKYINAFLIYKKLLREGQKLTLPAIRLAFRIETTFNFNPIFQQVSLNNVRHTLLAETTFLRMISNKYFFQQKEQTKSESITNRQLKAWSANTASKVVVRASSRGSQTKPHDGTVSMHIKLITAALEPFSKNKIKDFKQGEYRTSLVDWLENKDNSKRYPYVWLLKSWLFKLTFYGGSKKAKIRYNTVVDYVKTLAMPFIAEFLAADVNLITQDEWVDKLNCVADQIKSAQRKGYVYYFAEFLVDSGILPYLPLEELDSHSYKGRVDANLITLCQADVIIDKLSQVDSEVSAIARLLFNFGFYSGNRRGEISFAKLKDFKFGDSYSQFHVRINQHRLLKSPSSARNIPLEVFWPEHELSFLQEFLVRRRQNHAREHSQLFPDKTVLEKSFELVTLLLHEVTGDQSMRFHHLRHSFANWTWLLLNWRYPATITDCIACLSHHYFSLERKKLLLTRLGLPKGASRKRLFTLTQLLGHADISTTLASYLHTMDLFIYLEKSREFENLTKLVRHTYGYGVIVNTAFPNEVNGSRNFPSEVTFISTPEVSSSFRPFTLKKAFIENFILPKYITIIGSSNEKSKSKRSVSVFELLAIATKMSRHESNTKIRNDIGVSESLLINIRQVSQAISKSYPKTSKKKLPLFPIDGLSAYQEKIISSLAQRFDALPDKPDLSKSLQCMTTLVSSKSFLIRSAEPQTIGNLLKLLDDLKFTDRHLVFSWFLPVKKTKNSQVYMDLDLALIAVIRWKRLIHRTLGFKNAAIKLVLPKGCTYPDVTFSPYGQVVRSEEGVFLGMSQFGTMATNVKRLKTENQRLDTQLSIRNPRRSYALIAFLHLLLIFNELN